MPVSRITVLPSALNQHCAEVKDLGRRYGFHMAIDSLCGFCAMACALDLLLRDQDVKLMDQFPSEPRASPVVSSASYPTSSSASSAAASLPPSAASSTSLLRPPSSAATTHPSTPLVELPAEANALSLIRLEDIFTWVQQRRIAYVKRHPEDFAPDPAVSLVAPSNIANIASLSTAVIAAGPAASSRSPNSPAPTPAPAGKRDSRPTKEAYLSMLVSTIEISEWISQLPLECSIALLCNIIEGPEVDARSIRFPRGAFVSFEETEFLLKEQRFYSVAEPVDFFVISSGGQCLSLGAWGEEVIKENRVAPQLDFLILDFHGHYSLLRITPSRSEGDEEGGARDSSMDDAATDPERPIFFELTVLDSLPGAVDDKFYLDSPQLRAVVRALGGNAAVKYADAGPIL